MKLFFLSSVFFRDCPYHIKIARYLSSYNDSSALGLNLPLSFGPEMINGLNNDAQGEREGTEFFSGLIKYAF